MSEDGPNAKALFEILVHEHADMLECYLRSHLGNSANIDDLFQETMLVAWRRIGDYDRSRPFALWLYGIARNLILEHRRKNARTLPPLDTQVLLAMDRRFESLPLHGREAFQERIEHLTRCLGRLPESMREAINLVYQQNLSPLHASASIGVNKETFRKRVQRGRLLLAECMGFPTRSIQELLPDEGAT